MLFNPFKLTWKLEDLRIKKKRRRLPVHGQWHQIKGDIQTCEMEVLNFYTFFVQAVKPKIVVETGSFHGISAHYIALGLPEKGHVFSVEYDKKKYNKCCKFQKKTKKKNITFMLEDSTQCDWSNSLEKESVDMALIDCSYRYEALDNLFPYLRQGAYILLHDTIVFDFSEDINLFLNSGLIDSVITLETCRGLTIFRKA